VGDIEAKIRWDQDANACSKIPQRTWEQKKIPFNEWINKIDIYLDRDVRLYPNYWAEITRRANAEALPLREQELDHYKEERIPSTWDYATTRTRQVPVMKTVVYMPAKAIRRMRAKYQLENPPRPKYGPKIDFWIQDELRDLVKEHGDHCNNNWRWADKKKSGEVRRYKRARDSGCCGSYDTEVEYKPLFGKSRTFLLGFNYGH